MAIKDLKLKTGPQCRHGVTLRKVCPWCLRSDAEKTETLVLNDKYSGSKIELLVRGGIVVGACGCEPRRYMGLTLDAARHYAHHGQTSTPATR